MEAKDDASLADELEPWQVFRSLATPVTFWHDEQGWKGRADAFTAALRRQQSGEAVVEHIAAILEEWDMKQPPDPFTGHDYRDIARDILTRAALSARLDTGRDG